MLFANLWALSQDIVTYASRMYQIPCSNCHFFTENYQLKCTIHPIEALTEAAIDCPDYQSNDYSFSLDPNPMCSTSNMEKAITENSRAEPMSTKV